jgi:hypothetical protein
MNQYPATYSYYPYQPQPVNNSTATVGFVLGLIGFFLPFGLLSLIGVFVSLSGLEASKRLPGRSGHGMAVAGLVLSLVVIAGWFVLLFAFVISSASS